jgi:hypothetical protein
VFAWYFELMVGILVALIALCVVIGVVRRWPRRK